MADAKILERGLKVLEVLAQGPKSKTVAEVAETIGAHKTSVYRYLNTLLAMGYVKKDGNGYCLGNKILELGGQMLQRMPVRETAHPFLVKLSTETQKTVHLCVLDGSKVVYLDKIESQRSLPIISRIGSRAPAYCTAVGKVLLSSLPTDRVVELLRETPLTKRTPTTITDPVKLLEELKLTRERGYAIDNGEHEEGIQCFAAPIRGYTGDIVEGISITGLVRDFLEPQQAQEAIEAVMATAAEISQALGYLERRIKRE